MNSIHKTRSQCRHFSEKDRKHENYNFSDKRYVYAGTYIKSINLSSANKQFSSMVWDSAWVTNSYPNNWKALCFVESEHCHRSLQWDSSLSFLSPIYIFTIYFSEVIIILSSLCVSVSSDFFPFGLQIELSFEFLFFSHACYILFPS